ncbi:hypothetical protein TNCV_3239921 [Trichonephila clavipes]|nr:hypothetical protein TNCV_3239921 [Trichonephila clavipes]
MPASKIILVQRVIIRSHYEAARRLLATNLVILNHGQATWTTLELATTSSNLDRFNVQWPSLQDKCSVVLSSNSGNASDESVTLTTRLPWPRLRPPTMGQNYEVRCQQLSCFLRGRR